METSFHSTSLNRKMESSFEKNEMKNSYVDASQSQTFIISSEKHIRDQGFERG